MHRIIGLVAMLIVFFGAMGATATPAFEDAHLTVFGGVYVPGNPDLAAAGLDLRVEQAGTLTFVSLDSPEHNVVSDEMIDGIPFFQSASIRRGDPPTPVNGVSTLQPGTYGFYCTHHPAMRGLLVVEPN